MLSFTATFTMINKHAFKHHHFLDAKISFLFEVHKCLPIFQVQWSIKDSRRLTFR